MYAFLIETMEQINNEEFIAKESKVINVIFGVFFLILLLVAFSNITFDASNKSILYIIGVIALPTVYFWKKVLMTKPQFLFNAVGLYYNEDLITNWDNFYSAYIDALETIGEASDQFVLIVYYYNPHDNRTYQISLKISQTLDKSHEEIMNAIKKYSNISNEQKN